MARLRPRPLVAVGRPGGLEIAGDDERPDDDEPEKHEPAVHDA
jgi:hypothetical protein